MGFEELFNQGHRRASQNHDDHYRQDRDNHYRQDSNNHYRQDDPYRNDDHYRQNENSHSSHSYGQQNDIKQQILNKLRDNPQLKTMLIVGAIF